MFVIYIFVFDWYKSLSHYVKIVLVTYLSLSQTTFTYQYYSHFINIVMDET